MKGPHFFEKRKKELARQEKAKQKAERKAQRKAEKGKTGDDDDLPDLGEDGLPIEDELGSGEPSQPAAEASSLPSPPHEDS